MKQVQLRAIKAALLQKAPNKVRIHLDSIVIQNDIMFYSNSITGMILRNQIISDSIEDYKVVIPRSAIKELLELNKNLEIKVKNDDLVSFDKNRIVLNGISVDISRAEYPYTNVYEQFNQYNLKDKSKDTNAVINPAYMDLVSKTIKLYPEVSKLHTNIFNREAVTSGPIQYILGNIEIYHAVYGIKKGAERLLLLI